MKIHPAIIERQRREREDTAFEKSRIQPSVGIRPEFPEQPACEAIKPASDGILDLTVDLTVDFTI